MQKNMTKLDNAQPPKYGTTRGIDKCPYILDQMKMKEHKSGDSFRKQCESVWGYMAFFKLCGQATSPTTDGTFFHMVLSANGGIAPKTL